MINTDNSKPETKDLARALGQQLRQTHSCFIACGLGVKEDGKEEIVIYCRSDMSTHKRAITITEWNGLPVRVVRIEPPVPADTAITEDTSYQTETQTKEIVPYKA